VKKPTLTLWVVLLLAGAWLLADVWSPAFAGSTARSKKTKRSAAPVEAKVEPETDHGQDEETLVVAEDDANAEHHGDESHAEATPDGEQAHHDGQGEATAHTEEPKFVTPPRKPTEVKIGIYVMALTRVDPPAVAHPTFEVEAYLDLTWNDPRLAFDPDEVGVSKEVFLEHEAELELERIWWPDIEFENAEGERDVAGRELVILPDGTVDYSERFHGKFSFDPDLRNFPMDRQEFRIHLESFAWDERALLFVANEEKTGHDPAMHTQEWIVHSVTKGIVSKQEVRAPAGFSAVTLTISAERESGYYLWKILGPILIIVILNWSTFWMPGEQATSRMERAFIGLLTVVAFHQIISGNLPRIGYLTLMDGVVFIAFGAVGVTIFSIMLTQRYERLGRTDIVDTIDLHARWIFPLLVLLAFGVLAGAYYT
jgi:hypothetical protein